MAPNAKPLLVTGMPRSATTWVGRALAASNAIHFVNEPFNPNNHPGVAGQRIGFERWFTHLDDRSAAPYQHRLDRIYQTWWSPLPNLHAARSPRSLTSFARCKAHAISCRMRGGSPVYKDPIAILSAEWLAQRYGLAVVVMVRHPLSFVGSMKNRNWSFDFNNFHTQPALTLGPLASHASTIQTLADSDAPIHTRSAWLWKMLMHAVLGYRETYPDWRFQRAEDLAEDPHANIQAICQLAGINLDEQITQAVERMASAKNPVEVDAGEHWWNRNVAEVGNLWKSRLTQQEATEIREITSPEADAFYQPETWG